MADLRMQKYMYVYNMEKYIKYPKYSSCYLHKYLQLD